MSTPEELLNQAPTAGAALPPSMLNIPEDDGNDHLMADEEAPSPAPAKNKKARAEAFADRVAHERATSLLGTDMDDVVAGMTAAPKKVSEKAYNALCYLADRGKLSVFTQQALDHLIAGQTMKSADLVSLFKGMNYSEKTARSQAQQQMVVLPILKVATRAGDTLTLQQGHMLNLFDEAGKRTPEEKQANRKPRTKGPDAETVLADAPVQEPEEAPEPAPAHDTEVVEDLLVGQSEPAQEDLSVVAAPAPSKLHTMSAEDAIEAFAAEMFGTEPSENASNEEGEEASKSASKRSRKPAKKKKK